MALERRPWSVVPRWMVATAFALCAGDLDAQVHSGGGLSVRAGAHAPLWAASTSEASRAEIRTAPMVGVVLQRSRGGAFALRAGGEIALAARSEIRLTEEACAFQREMSAFTSCTGTGPSALAPLLFGGLVAYWSRLYLAADGGALFFFSQGSDCALADLVCAAAGGFPPGFLTPGLRSAVGVRWPFGPGRRDIILEIGDFVTFEDGDVRHELTMSLGAGWW